MKILFCTSDTEGRIASGPNAWIQRLVPNLLNEHGLNIHTLITYYGKKEQCPTINYFIDNKYPVHFLNKNKYTYIEDQTKQILRIVKKERIELLVANLVVPGLYSAKYLRKSGIPVIGVIHSNDDFYKSIINKFGYGNKNLYISHFVCVSDFLEAELKKKNRHNIPSSTIPCGSPLPSNIKATYQFPLKIVYTGRIVIEQKQILKLADAFIKASEEIKGTTFSIYGSGPQENELKQLLEGNNKVRYRGAVPPSQILTILGSYQIFTLMSDYEGMPVALMEAMACGLVPICLEESSGINEIIKNGENGFIVKDCKVDYQTKLAYLQMNPEEWKRMSKNAIKTIVTKYSSEITHLQWANLFKSYIGITTKKIRIPWIIKIKGEHLFYGDDRKPDLCFRINQALRKYWIIFRLFVRPRSRIRNFLNQ